MTDLKVGGCEKLDGNETGGTVTFKYLNFCCRVRLARRKNLSGFLLKEKSLKRKLTKSGNHFFFINMKELYLNVIRLFYNSAFVVGLNSL